MTIILGCRSDAEEVFDNVTVQRTVSENVWKRPNLPENNSAPHDAAQPAVVTVGRSQHSHGDSNNPRVRLVRSQGVHGDCPRYLALHVHVRIVWKGCASHRT